MLESLELKEYHQKDDIITLPQVTKPQLCSESESAFQIFSPKHLNQNEPENSILCFLNSKTNSAMR